MRLNRKPDINQFLNRRQPAWSRLEEYLTRVETAGLDSLTTAEVREFGALYRKASSDLLTARAKTANADVLQYLNALVARSYAQVYRARRFELRDLSGFLLRDFPSLFRQSIGYVAVCIGIMLASGIAGWCVNAVDPAVGSAILPAGMIKQFPQLREHWGNATGHVLTPQTALATSSFLMTHNIGLGILAFAGGLFFGLGPLYGMIQTGAMVGVMGQEMSRTAPTALVFWSLIIPHGVTELLAICVMGAAGFMLTHAIIAPGNRTRRDALVERGRPALLLAMGGAAMLVIAGLIEGIITPPAFIPPEVKLVFGILTIGGWVGFFSFAGRGSEAGVLSEGVVYEEEA